MITQKDVAKKAGVTFITVSRVVNNEGNVKEETRKKVEEAIKELGYFPSFSGKALNSGKCNTIAIATPITYDIGGRSEYLLGLLSGIDTISKSYDCDVLLNTFDEDDTTYDYLRAFRQRKVDGIIYVGLKKMPEVMLQELKTFKFPCVVIGDRPIKDGLSWVDTDNFTAGYNSTKELIKLGHKNIGFFGLNENIFNQNISDRESGYLQAMQEAFNFSKNDCRKFIIRSSYDRPSILENFENYIKDNISSKDFPSAIFCSTDERIPSVLKVLKKYNLSVPEDISLVGFDGFLIDNPFLDFSIATNPQPLKEMGKKAAEMLFERIKNPELESSSHIFQVPFLSGDSIKSI